MIRKSSVETKRCSSCAIRKPLSKFSANKAKNDGLSNYCKDCGLKQRRTRSKELREALLKVFEGKCYFCGKVYKDKVNFNFHAIDGKRHREDPWYIKAHLGSFRLLCERCHYQLGGIMKLLNFSWERIVYEYQRCHPNWKPLINEKKWEPNIAQKIQEEIDYNTQKLRSKNPKSERRMSVLSARIEMLQWAKGLLVEEGERKMNEPLRVWRWRGECLRCRHIWWSDTKPKKCPKCGFTHAIMKDHLEVEMKVKNNMGYLQTLRKVQNWKDKSIPKILWLPACVFVLAWVFILAFAVYVKGDKKR